MCPVRRTVAGDALASRRHCQTFYPPRGYRRAFGTSPGGVRRRNPPVECRTDISRKSQVISGKKNDTFVIRAKRTARTPTPRRALALPPRVFGGLTNMPFPTESPTRSTRRVHRGPRCGTMSNILVLVFLGNALARADAYPTPFASPGPHARGILRHLTVHVHGVRRECS